jgi:uncharacterized RDD family membrane protein YckC
VAFFLQDAQAYWPYTKEASMLLKSNLSRYAYAPLRLWVAHPASRQYAYAYDTLIFGLLVGGASTAAVHVFHLLCDLIGRSAQLQLALATPFAGVCLLLSYIAYFTLSEWLTSTTIGKQIVGIQVVANGGSPCGFWAALIRNVLRPIDAVCYALQISSGPAGSLQQRFGDRVAATLVVRCDAHGLPAPAAHKTSLALLLFTCWHTVGMLLVYWLAMV